MNEGYIKLYRKVIDNGWLRNHELWTFWCWCLLKASHKDCITMVGYQRVELKPGQLVFGRKTASKELKMSEQKIRTCCSILKTLQNITIKSTNKYSMLSVINWDTYQSKDMDNNQQANQRLTNNQPATNHKQECKELKNGKNVSPSLSPISSSNTLEIESAHTSHSRQGISKTTNPNIKIFIDWYSDQFQSIFGEKPKIDGGKDGAIIKRLLKIYTIEKLIELGEKFFDSQDEFIQKSGYTIGVFSAVINKLLVGDRNRDPTGGKYQKGPDLWYEMKMKQLEEEELKKDGKK